MFSACIASFDLKYVSVAKCEWIVMFSAGSDFIFGAIFVKVLCMRERFIVIADVLIDFFVRASSCGLRNLLNWVKLNKRLLKPNFKNRFLFRISFRDSEIFIIVGGCYLRSVMFVTKYRVS